MPTKFLCENKYFTDDAVRFTYRLLQHVGQDSVFGIETRYELDGPGIESRQGRNLPQPSRLALGPVLPPVQWVPGLFSKGKEAGAWR